MGLSWIDKINDAGSVEWKVSLGQCNVVQVPSYVISSIVPDQWRLMISFVFVYGRFPLL